MSTVEDSSEAGASAPGTVGIEALLDGYAVVLLDAYGVLVDKLGPLPGSIDLIKRLNSSGKPYFILTNSAIRLPATMAGDFRVQGLFIPAERIISSGVLRHKGPGAVAPMYP